jgi:hypothetical protein
MKYKKITSFILSFSLIIFSFLPLTQIALAASITSLSDTMSRLKASTASNHEIKFVTPSGVQATETIILTFSAGFTGVTDIVHGDIDFAEGDSNNCSTATFTEKTLAASASGATWGADGDGATTVTLTSDTGTVTADRCVRIRIGTNAVSQSTGVHQISNGAAAAADIVTISGTFGDSGILSVEIITDDQVVISAIVEPTLTFTVTDNTIFFGILKSSGTSCWAQGTDPGNVTCPTTTETGAHDLTASTNATSGYVITMTGSTLTSASSDTITGIGAVNTAPSIGSEQFGVRFNASGGSGAVTAPYADSGYAFDPTQPSQIASSAGPSATTTYSARYIANISALTEAGTYTTTLNYIATATF